MREGLGPAIKTKRVQSKYFNIFPKIFFFLKTLQKEATTLRCIPLRARTWRHPQFFASEEIPSEVSSLVPKIS